MSVSYCKFQIPPMFKSVLYSPEGIGEGQFKSSKEMFMYLWKPCRKSQNRNFKQSPTHHTERTSFEKPRSWLFHNWSNNIYNCMLWSPLTAAAPFEFGVQNFSENCPVAIFNGNFDLKTKNWCRTSIEKNIKQSRRLVFPLVDDEFLPNLMLHRFENMISHNKNRWLELFCWKLCTSCF